MLSIEAGCCGALLCLKTDETLPVRNQNISRKVGSSTRRGRLVDKKEDRLVRPTVWDSGNSVGLLAGLTGVIAHQCQILITVSGVSSITVTGTVSTCFELTIPLGAGKTGDLIGLV